MHNSAVLTPIDLCRHCALHTIDFLSNVIPISTVVHRLILILLICGEVSTFLSTAALMMATHTSLFSAAVNVPYISMLHHSITSYSHSILGLVFTGLFGPSITPSRTVFLSLLSFILYFRLKKFDFLSISLLSNSDCRPEPSFCFSVSYSRCPVDPWQFFSSLLRLLYPPGILNNGVFVQRDGFKKFFYFLIPLLRIPALPTSQVGLFSTSHDGTIFNQMLSPICFTVSQMNVNLRKRRGKGI